MEDEHNWLWPEVYEDEETVMTAIVTPVGAQSLQPGNQPIERFARWPEVDETVELAIVALGPVRSMGGPERGPVPPEPTTSSIAAIPWPLSDRARGITGRLVQRYRSLSIAPAVVDLGATAQRRAVVVSSATPTERRPEPARFCYQCGAAAPPWRDCCGSHDRRHGRGLPQPARLVALDSESTLRDTLKLRVVRRRAA